MAEKEKRLARLTRIIFQAADSHYIVGVFRDQDSGVTFTATGNVNDPLIGQDYDLTVEPTEHPRYGKQLRILAIAKHMPDTTDAIVNFLSSASFPGVGKKFAQSVVDTLGEDCLQKIQEDSQCLLQVPNMTKKKFATLVEGIREFAGSAIYLKLVEWNVPSSQISLLQEHYKDLESVLADDPFRPLYEVNGFGYKSAVKMADGMEMDIHDLRRVDARLYDNIRSLSFSSGNTFVTLYDLYDTVIGMDQEVFEASLDRLIENGWIEEEVRRLYPYNLLSEEKDIARRLELHRYDPGKVDEEMFEKKLAENEFARAIKYDPVQKSAIHQFLNSSLMIINGGPGTGKTTVVNAILQLYSAFFPNEVIKLAAPTGRAAKRLAQLSQRDAGTLHSLLRWKAEDNTFAVNEDNPLECDVLIVDEFSMVDTHLFSSLLKAMPAHCRLLLIGDEDQLESVGPGKVFQDLIASKRIPVVHLEHIFRQQEGSGIVTLAREIRDEKKPHYTAGAEFAELEAQDIPQEILARVKDDFDPDKVQALAPQYDGPAGINAINERMQEALNPARPDLEEVKIGNIIFREGDKVMLKRNRPDEGIYNGDMGVIAEVVKSPLCITVDFGDTLGDFTTEILQDLDHAWCVSVHKAQGSEYDSVYCVASAQNPHMLYKKLLYTAVSRAKKKLVLLGNKSSFERRVKMRERHTRQTTLLAHLEQAMPVDENDAK